MNEVGGDQKVGGRDGTLALCSKRKMDSARSIAYYTPSRQCLS